MRAHTVLAPLAALASTLACGSVAPSAPVDTDSPASEKSPPPVSALPDTSRPQAGSDAPSSRTRWLASTTMVSSASTQSLLHLVDLRHPELAPIEVERQNASAVTYSPDGRWLFYQSFRSKTEARLYVVDVSGDTPSAPKLLFTSVRSRPCAWSPDSTKLACIEQTDPDASVAAEVIFFDGFASAPGPAIQVGSFAKGAHVLDNVFWLDDETLVFPGEGSLTKVTCRGGTAPAPEPFAAPGGAIVRLSADRRRALVTGIGDYDSKYLETHHPTFRLVDLELGASVPLPSHRYWSFSDALDAAIAVDPSETSPSTQLYYRISGTHVVGPVATIALDEERWPWSRSWQMSAYTDSWLGSRRIEMRAGRPVVVTIGDGDVTEEAVPGEYPHVENVRPSPDGTSLYIGSVLLDDAHEPIEATGTHWLSRIVDGHPRPAEPFAKGYRTGGGTTISFSPDSRKLLLHGDHGYLDAPPSPVPFHLYDVARPAADERKLDVSLRWAESVWSKDSSYISIVGAMKARTSFVVDAFDARSASRQLFSCSSNPAPLPGCPNGATF